MKLFKSILRRLKPYLLSSSVADDHYAPSAGRWLWNEPQRRQEHTRKFDLKAPEYAVLQALGLNSCSATVHVEKLAEGASNKVFRATIDRHQVIIKIPDPVVTPRLSTASEVATLEFLRSELGLPVPQVFSWSNDSSNSVGSEFIILEDASGQAFNTAWTTLGIKAKISVVGQILSVQKRLVAAADMFKGYGSLYFSDDVARLGLPRSLPVATTTSAQASMFSLSVLAHHHFTHPALATSNVLCGPWVCAEDYLVSVAQSSIAQLKTSLDQESNAMSDRPFSFPVKTASDTSRSAQMTMLELLCTAIPQIIPHSQEQCLPLIWHGDLHLGNIFVLPDGKITAIVDWKGTKVLPLFLQAKIPSFIDLDEDLLLLGLPDNFSDLPEPTRADTWERFRQSMLRRYYITDLREKLPGLAATIEDVQQAPLRKEVEVFAQISHGHDADALLLRETLLRVQRQWPALVEDNTRSTTCCPINIAGDELKRHQQDGRRYNEFQDLLKARRIPVADDGWVHANEFEERKADLRKAIEDFEHSLDKQERLEFKERLGLWNLTDWHPIWV